MKHIPLTIILLIATLAHGAESIPNVDIVLDAKDKLSMESAKIVNALTKDELIALLVQLKISSKRDKIYIEELQKGFKASREISQGLNKKLQEAEDELRKLKVGQF